MGKISATIHPEMKYSITFKPKALRDFENLPRQMQFRIISGVEKMSDNLFGDVKRLSNFSSEYRLRVGDYRAL